MKKPVFITVSAVLVLAAALCAFLALRPALSPRAPAADELRVRSELIAKNLGRGLSDPLANRDDLSLSELVAQVRADFPEVAEVIVADLRDNVVAASDGAKSGAALRLPDGVDKLSGQASLLQPAAAEGRGQSAWWAAAPVLLGREPIGAVYLRTQGPAAAAASTVPLPFVAGLAGSLLALLALVTAATPRGEVKVVASADAARVEEEKKQLERELDARKKELRKVEAEAADHTRWLEMFRSEENDLAMRVKKLREELSDLDAKVDSGRKQLIEHETLLRDKTAKLEEVSVNLTARIQEGVQLDQRLEAVQRQEADLNQRLVDLKKGEENLASWLKSSKVEVQNLVRFIAEKRVEESELEQQVEETRSGMVAQEKRAEQLRSEVEELTGICEQLSAERNRLALEVGEKQQNLTAVMKLLEGSRSRLEKMQQQHQAPGGI
jgi:predicted  nucleic acid-binding Zn-ribbon protein